MIELNVTQGSESWHQARAKCFNASEAPAMQGVSPYKTRSALLDEKATGIVPEVDAATQARFDNGHAVEALARPLIEEIIGEELYPIVATDDSGKYLASSDGATMLCNIGFEHKLWNSDIAAQVIEGNVPESHRAQLDHQFLVFGFDKIIFVCSDGTAEKMVHCWYYPQPERIAALKAGWEQFAADLANYQHTETKPAAVAEVIDDLPALTVQLVGQVTASNLADFKTAVTARIQAINTTLVTDNDFATADKMVKFLDDGEKRLDLVKSQALAQTASIDKLFRTIDSLKAEMKAKRLTLSKLVTAEKENRKGEIVIAASREFGAHCAALGGRVGIPVSVAVSFADAVKGLKSLDSMRDKVSVALANAKIEANAIADRIEANRKTVEDMSLFPDFGQVCTKAPDDFAALLAMRTNARKEAEEKRLAAEREKIRAEEQAKAQAEQRRIAEAEQDERNRIAAEEIRRLDSERQASEKLAAANQTQFDKTYPNGEPMYSKTTIKENGDPMMLDPDGKRSIFCDIDEGDDKPAGQTIKLGEICTRLGFTVNADFLASLGIHPSATDKNAKLYPENKFPTICRLISEHVMALAFKKAA
jgi:putative phage-type endonuclease